MLSNLCFLFFLMIHIPLPSIAAIGGRPTRVLRFSDSGRPKESMGKHGKMTVACGPKSMVMHSNS